MKLKQTFDRDGFVIVRQFLSADDFNELTENLDRYIRDVVPTLPDGDAFYHDKSRPETLKQLQHMGSDSYFRDYIQHPRWNTLAETLLGEPVVVQQPEWFNKPTGTDHATPPHQDNYYFNLSPPNVVTIWLALETVDRENGCLRYVPGSHLHGLRPHGATKVLGFSQGISDYGPHDQAQEVVVQLDAGDAVVHHGETIHRADANRSSNRTRRAFAMVIRGESCRRNEQQYEQYLKTLKNQHEAQGLET